ncbi:aminotransferase class V-fold PLP-dependent enzyme [Ruminococcaceae bacterium OttesenSCG-928-I18]|nr:aminotransferase class V-fold PLP-dependent enzyme [Ruminococcaceae bacterium OttesenSCG-928-I18]
MREQIYLDNASTSFPKAPGVVDAMRFFIEDIGCNVNRGSYEGAYSAAGVVIETREKLAKLFGFPKSKNVIFTPNVTTSLNLLIKGLLRPGDHVLVSSMEHNGLMRPLVQMESQGVRFTRLPCDNEGRLLLDQVTNNIEPATKALFVLHASNVCGTLLPITELGKICQRHGLFFVLDAAQTAGVFPLHMQEMHIDALAFTGHKSLLGPQGIGGFVIRDEMAEEVQPLLSGGTGSISDSESVPAFLPDRYEPGTMNLPGIYGLNASLTYLEEKGMDALRRRELSLAQRLGEGLGALPQANIIGHSDWQNRAPIVSVDFPLLDNAEISFRLADEYNILTRCGLHCAPNAHKTLGTFPQGTVRFSPSHFNTEEEIDACLSAVAGILSKRS